MPRERRCPFPAAWSGALVSVAVLLRTTVGSAEERLETARLSYAASGTPARCPDEESFRNKVAARLGYQPFSANGAHRVSVRLITTAGRVRGHAEVTRSDERVSGVRDLEGGADECEPVTAALAVAVAIALDPVRSAQPGAGTISEPAREREEEPPPPAPPLPRASSDLPPRDAPQPVAPAPRPGQSRVAIFGAAGAVAAVGLAPGPSAGGSVGLGLRWRAMSVELSGRAETTPAPVRVDSGDRLEATAFSSLLAVCAHLDRASACGSGRIGVIQGHAPDVTDPTLRTSTFGALGVRAGYLVPLTTALALRGLVSAELPLVRTSFIIDKSVVWTAPPALAGLEIGIVLAVP